MRNFIFVVGSLDLFESIEELREAVEGGSGHYSIYEFSLPYHPENEALNIPYLVGAGMAFMEGWCADGIFSYVEEVVKS